MAAMVKNKKKSGHGNVKPGVAEAQQEDILKAVVICDTFQDRFMPFSVERPRCLLHLANIPLIDYTLDFLQMNDVQEVYIYAFAHEKQVRKHVESQRRWNMFDRLEFISVANAHSIGDFLRDVDKRGKITSNFILVYGDVISNIDLKKHLDNHRKRCDSNRDTLMTMVLRSDPTDQPRMSTQAVTPVFTLDYETNRVLAYDEMSPVDDDHFFKMEPSHLSEFAMLTTRADLIDPGIDICSPSVLTLWSESFDYSLPRKHFLHGILKDFELNGALVYADVLDQGFAMRADNLPMYERMWCNVLGRWTMPYVPCQNLFPGQAYKHSVLDNVSMEDVKVTLNTKLDRCVVGSGCTIGASGSIVNSIIGRNCVIGQNVFIEDCVIWDSVVIGNGATIKRSIIADSARIGSECVVPAGSLVSFNVIVGDGIRFKEAIVLSTVDQDGIRLSPNPSLLGPKTNAAAFPGQDEIRDAGDPESLQKSLIYSTEHLNLSAESVSSFNSHDIDDEGGDNDDDDDMLDSESEVFTPTRQHRRTLSQSAGSTSGFHKDAVNLILDTLRATNASDADFASTRPELTGLRLSTNAANSEFQRAVAVAFAKRVVELMHGQGHVSSSSAMSAAEAVKTTISFKGAAKFLTEFGLAGHGSASAEDSQVDFILALQAALLSIRELDPARAGSLLALMLQHIYHADVLDEDGVRAWWMDPRSKALVSDDDSSMAIAREKVKPLIEWFDEAEEESEEDEDEDDGEDGEEEDND